MTVKRKPVPRKHASVSSAVDEQLARYRSMRDFDVTAEPSGGDRGGKAGVLPFVIQKHAASHLHYDFRLGWNGVLKSWAVAKGPSYHPKDKRLAVQVEDHPMEYGGFEGIIPQGQYGGGTVMLWDQGTWEPQPGHTDVDEGLKAGSLKFVLHGKKLKGKWALIRMGGKAANERKPNWLLIKEHDDFERSADQPCITEEAPNSVVTGRDLEQIAAGRDHVWNSKGSSNAGLAKASPSVEIPRAAAQEKLPDFLPPQLATQATSPPDGAGWLHELKLDGYRIQARKDGETVRLLTRSGLDWTTRMKSIAAEIAALPCENAILDGEVVVLAPDGTTSFADLQAAFQDGARKRLTYFVFDLLHLNGRNLRNLKLSERKALLTKLVDQAGEAIQASDYLETSGQQMFHKACELHAEGIVSKRADSKYSSGRSSDWLKLKCIHEQEFVIGGFTLPSKGHAGIHGVGALLLGYYRKGKLIYAGRTGTGFTQASHRSVRDRLEPLRRATAPFDDPPSEAKRGAIWVKPQLVAQVNFATWTADDLVRQASFKGLREDKPAREVVQEESSTAPKPRPSGVQRVRHAAPAQVAAKVAPARRAGSAKAKDAPVRLTHPDKIIDAESGLTKQELADYLWAVAPHMLPHIEGRPLSLVRCPGGAQSPCFFQKHFNATLPAGVQSVEVPDKKTGKAEAYITLSTAEALAGLAQIGVLEIHPWGSRNDDLEHPDRIIIDLDPDAEISWPTLAKSAAEVREQLQSIGLESFLKTTGGKGLHVVVPLQPKADWAAVKEFSHSFVLAMEQQWPELYLTKMSKAARKGRIFLDYLRNERGSTAVAPYSPRARAGVAVALPLEWSDLKLRERPVFQVTQLEEWSDQLKRDPWAKMAKVKQHLKGTR
jgi:bifunctional non-homologous end joining protein LigD